jgi:hypothetical protein
MTRPLIMLHIGRGKTGTTAIQRFLFSNRDALLEQGICYPLVGAIPQSGHLELSMSCMDQLPESMKWSNRLDSIQQDTAAEMKAQGVHRFLLSSENFPQSNPVTVRSFLDSVFPEAQYKIIF